MTRLIGIMGGMFDPVHQGHLQAARAAYRQCQLDEVVLVPCGNPVHRSHAQALASQRCDMLKLAIAGEPWLRLDTRECTSQQPSRTRDTLAGFAQEEPEASLHFILGVDAFLTLSSWYHWREIFDLAHLLVLTRPGYDLQAGVQDATLRQELDKRRVNDCSALKQSRAGCILLLAAATPELSSTEIKIALRAGRATTGLLPAAVADYIETNQLYR